MIQLESSTEPVFRVLVLRRHVVGWDLMTLAYWVKCFLSLALDQHITLLSSHFTWGKIASECDVTFEWYRTWGKEVWIDCFNNKFAQIIVWHNLEPTMNHSWVIRSQQSTSQSWWPVTIMEILKETRKSKTLILELGCTDVSLGLLLFKKYLFVPLFGYWHLQK